MSKILKVVGASWLQTKISSYILCFLGFLAILALFVGLMERVQDDGNYAATVFHSKKTGYRIEYWGQSNDLAEIPRGVARAYFRQDVETAGWSLLEIETEASYPDEIQAYAAGIVEGALTWYLIHTHLENTIRAKCDNTPLEKQCGKLTDALEKSVKIWKSHAVERSSESPFWHHVSLHYTQIDGIYTGWKYGVERSQNEYDTDISDLYWLNSISELSELQHKFNISLDGNSLDRLPGFSSAFLRVVNETSEDGEKTKKFYVAQNAAGSYSSMTRILKRYKLNYHLTSEDNTLAPGTQVNFAGYPGSVTSHDEFYVLQGLTHRMAVTGTILRNYNNKLWKKVNVTDQVPLASRVTAANHLAANVSDWVHVIATNNSGTGCKQWMVVDFNRFETLHDTTRVEKKKEVVTEINFTNDVLHTIVHRGHINGLMWLVEQVPGLTHARDLSAVFLERGYFATYGLPYSKDIADCTQTTEMQKLYGNLFSMDDSPRAAVFRRGYKNATSLDEILKLMRQNNLTALNSQDRQCEKDCIFRERGYSTVLGVRGDLVDKYREPYGVIDTKVVSGTLNDPLLEFTAVAGPPYTKKINSTKTTMNKGNIAIASTYTDQFNNKPTIDGLQIRDLIKQQQFDEEQEKLEVLNRDAVEPFEWSQSEFKNEVHEGLPDKWEFGKYKPKFSW